VIGDIANAVWQISEALNDTSHWDFTRLKAIREANEAQIAEGATAIRVVPVFLGTGAHVAQDLPRLVERARTNHPRVAITLEPPIGEQPAVIDAIAAAIIRPGGRASS